MNPSNADFIKIELTSGSVHRSFTNHTLCAGDKAANIYGIELYKNGEKVNPTGTCVGYFMRNNQDTVVIQGQIENNRAWVTLPESCYAQPGQFTLAIKVTDGVSFTDGIRIVDGTVVETFTGAIIDPGGVIPNLSEILAAVADAEAAAAVIETLVINAVKRDGFDNLYRIEVTYGGGS